MGLLDLSKCKEPAFIKEGFNNWKKGTEKFDGHQGSESHRFAILQLQAHAKPSVSNQISTQHARNQEASRKALVKVFQALGYLLRQGLSFRGKTPGDGNFDQLLKLIGSKDSGLRSYLTRTTKFTSPSSQEEMINMIGHSVCRELANSIRQSGFFAIMVDGTQDVSGLEQESICFRHVDSDMEVHEHFVGLYHLPDTSSETIAKMIFDVMTRLELNPDNLRAQTYDGAANMKGKHNGCQAKVKAKHPLALHFHCASHLANLALEHSVTECTLILDAVQWVHELGVLFKRSSKYKAIFQDIASRSSESSDTDHLPSNRKSIRPLCPTRWLCRLPAITSVLENYPAVLESLQEMAALSVSESSAKANGLLDRFEKGSTLLALVMAAGPIAILEQLNSSCQAQSANISGLIEATNVCTAQLQSWRSEENFKDIFSQASAKVELYELDPLCLPRRRKCPKRAGGSDSQFHHDSPEQHFRQQYFLFLDRMVTELQERFGSSNQGLQTYNQLEQILIKGKIDSDQMSLVERYPEFKKESLSFQLSMFRQKTDAKTLHEAKIAFQGMHPEVRALFSQVEILLKVLLVCPVTSTSCERSFSALRRLKTWLRSTMSQQRLNSVALCHVHPTVLEDLNMHSLAKEFACRSNTRRIFSATSSKKVWCKSMIP